MYILYREILNTLKYYYVGHKVKLTNGSPEMRYMIIATIADYCKT